MQFWKLVPNSSMVLSQVVGLQILEKTNRIECPILTFQIQILTVEEEEKVMKLVEKYSDIFSKDKRDLGRTGLIKHELHITEALPIKQKPFRLPKQHIKEARSSWNR